jgi:glucoamylase
VDKGIEQPDITRPRHIKKARGRPGAKARWASGAKTIVGTAVRPESRIWYTINDGTIAEIYFPDVDQANTRSVRFIVTGEDFVSDEIWDADHGVEWLEDGVPGCRIESSDKSGNYRLTKEIIPHPMRDGLFLRGQFTPTGQQDLRLYLVIDAHMGDRGANNNAWAGDYKGEPMVFAQRGSVCLACGSSPQPLGCSVWYIGKSDGFTVLRRRKPLPESNYAPDGNVALTMEIDYKSTGNGSFLISLAGGDDSAEAGRQARAGLLEDYATARELFVREWREQQARYRDLTDLSGHRLDMYRVSTAVLETHQSKRFPGGFVAGLSIPWGFARGDKDIGGYHVLWPRDSVETAMGKLCSGDAHSARSALFFLACAQDSDGRWSQNMWLDGTPHWTALQMDAIALPILLADKMRREGVLHGYDPRPMVRQAACFMLRHGPVTEQDRWETTPGYSPNTMAAEVAALLAAADFAELEGAYDRAQFLRETADAWNDAIDELTYVEGTPLAHRYGVRGYYLRIAPPQRIRAREIGHLRIRMPNVRSGPKSRRAVDIVSPDALSLVRMGLRTPNDPRIVDTVKLLDATLRVETKTGAGWKRSTDDGYGEKADGRPYNTRGIGRCWPLLTGERAHYELAAGRREIALELLKTIARQTSECGMIPEQIWDAEDISERYLFNGQPTGSGMPLAWAHAEYIKLLRSLHEGAVWDRVPQTEQRYEREHRNASFQIWTPDQPRGWLTPGKDLRIDLPVPARVRWTTGKYNGEAQTTDSSLGLHCSTLPTRDLPPGTTLRVETEREQNAGDRTKIPASLTIRVKS